MRAWQPFQYSCLGNPMDSGVWQFMVHRVAKSQTRLKRLHAGKRRQNALPGEAELCRILGLEEGEPPCDPPVLTHRGGSRIAVRGKLGGCWNAVLSLLTLGY